jgi:uncharacterized protein (DUF2267 family)
MFPENIFANTIQKTHLIINEIGEAMGWQERLRQSFAALRMDRDEFLDCIRKEFILSMDRPVSDLVEAVLGSIEKHVAQGEIDDIKTTLPKGMLDLFSEV